VLPIGLSNLTNSNTSISLVNKSLNINESTIDTNINLNDALPVVDTSISSFGDYIVSYEDNNTSPVNVVIPSLTTSTDQTNTKNGGATVGMTANKKTITLTTYAGLLLWSHKLTDNQLLKDYYNTVNNVTDISSYQVINFAYLENKNILFVLFGEETQSNDTTTLSNLVVFGLDINSGAIVVPKNAKLDQNQIIAKARDNSAFIFFNSADQLLVTSGNNLANINKTTKIMNFDLDNGFSNVANKGNDDENNNFTYTKLSSVVKETDYLLGFIPSSVKGVNFSIWLYDTVYATANQTPQLSYAISNTKTGAPDMSINQGSNATFSFTYYVIAVSDDFTNITTNLKVINTDDDGANSRGFINNTKNLPDFNSIYKRFFITSSTTSGSNTTEKVGFLLDSFDDIFSSFAVSSFTITGGTNPTVDYGANKDTNTIYMNYLNVSPTIGPKKTDLDDSGIEDNVVADNWKFNTVAFDEKSKFVYFSLSSEEYSYLNNTKGAVIPGKYLTNTRYIDLSDSVKKANSISSDAYVTGNPYTLSDVNFDTYSDDNNIYLAKQVIDGNDGQWLWSSLENLTDDTMDFIPTGKEPFASKIDFSSLTSLVNDIQNSDVLNDVMPSVLNNNLSSLDDFINDKGLANTIKFIGASGNDETGEINLETKITYSNNFGDNIQNGLVSYTSFIQILGFSVKDFSLDFKDNTDSAVTDIKAKYSAEKIVETNNKAFVINNLMENFTIKDQNFFPEEEDVSLKFNEDSNSLVVEVKIPIKTSFDDENGILPVGFPEKDAVITTIYNGFTGTETPPFEVYPNKKDSGQNNQIIGNNLSLGIVAGILVGCLVVSVLIVIAFILIKIRVKTRSSF
ncbi:MAG: hypothetical protein K2K18_01820, partial [Malacoplasma sp.]|nr:hypothetical protein [Malacoplasma sp.]